MREWSRRIRHRKQPFEPSNKGRFRERRPVLSETSAPRNVRADLVGPAKFDYRHTLTETRSPVAPAGVSTFVFQRLHQSAHQAQKSRIERPTGDGPQQPAQVVAYRAQHRVQGIAGFTL